MKSNNTKQKISEKVRGVLQQSIIQYSTVKQHENEGAGCYLQSFPWWLMENDAEISEQTS